MRLTARFFVAILALLAVIGIAIALLLVPVTNPFTLIAWALIAVVVAIVAGWPALP